MLCFNKNMSYQTAMTSNLDPIVFLLVIVTRASSDQTALVTLPERKQRVQA